MELVKLEGSRCSECGAQDCLLVEVGEPVTADSATAWLCQACVMLALAKFTAAPREWSGFARG